MLNKHHRKPHSVNDYMFFNHLLLDFLFLLDYLKHPGPC